MSKATTANPKASSRATAIHRRASRPLCGARRCWPHLHRGPPQDTASALFTAPIYYVTTYVTIASRVTRSEVWRWLTENAVTGPFAHVCVNLFTTRVRMCISFDGQAAPVRNVCRA